MGCFNGLRIRVNRLFAVILQSENLKRFSFTFVLPFPWTFQRRGHFIPHHREEMNFCSSTHTISYYNIQRMQQSCLHPPLPLSDNPYYQSPRVTVPLDRCIHIGKIKYYLFSHLRCLQSKQWGVESFSPKLFHNTNFWRGIDATLEPYLKVEAVDRQNSSKWTM